MKVFIGIDPGKGGGIALISGSCIYNYSMPETPMDLWNIIDGLENSSGAIAALEIVHSSPQMGVKSAFTFGQGYGQLQMALTAVGIPWRGVRPQVWQKEMQCLTKGDKNVSKARAQQLFPSIKVTHAIADALLIAEWLRRQP